MKLILDLHLHSKASFDGRMGIEEIAALAKARGLDGVAICDHDVVYTGPTEVDGVLILPGVEFSTEYGHLLALFLSQEISYTTWEETTEAVHAQGGVTVLAHPFQKSRPASALLPLVPHLDGVEVWNSRANRKNPQANAQAAAFACQTGLVPTAGSDAHLPPGSGGRYPDLGDRRPLFGGHSQCDLGRPRDPGWAGGPLAVRGAEPVHETEKNDTPPSLGI